MCKNSISLNVHLEEPVYVDKNTVEIYGSINGVRQSNPIVAKFNGQVWQTVEK